jgi:2,3-bisphosphoglycerate-independent phosphoglycerate mutase
MAKGKKFILVTLDGAADRPCKELQDKTPYDVAFTPNIDFLASNGKCGMMVPVKEGIAPESDVAITAILGYDPYHFFTGRGPLEALGAGIDLKPGDLALRTNFATLGTGSKIIDRRVGRTLTTKEAFALAQTINKKIKLRFPFIFKPTVQHRGVLVIKGSFSDNITNTDPGYEKKGSFAVAARKTEFENAKPLDEEDETLLSASLVNSFISQSSSILKKHPVNLARLDNGQMPANIILTRDAGTELPELPKKKEKWLAVLSMPLEIGIAKLAGMTVMKCPYPEMKTPNVYDNLYLALKMYIDCVKQYLKANWKNYDCFWIHVKETDVPGHDGLALQKKKMIEIVDERLFSFLKNLDARICVTSDHTTPCSLKRHSDDPVPFFIYGIGKDRKINKFSERECKKGSLKKIYGKDLLNLCLK